MGSNLYTYLKCYGFLFSIHLLRLGFHKSCSPNVTEKLLKLTIKTDIPSVPLMFQCKPSVPLRFQCKPSVPLTFQCKPSVPLTFQCKPSVPLTFQCKPSVPLTFQCKPSVPLTFQCKPSVPLMFQCKPSVPLTFQCKPSVPLTFQYTSCYYLIDVYLYPGFEAGPYFPNFPYFLTAALIPY